MKPICSRPALLQAALCRYLFGLLALLPLAAAAAGPVLTLQGTGGTGTDVTAFIDQVEIVNVATGVVVSGAVANAGFELPSQTGVVNGFTYAPSGGSWTFGSAAGIAHNTSGLDNPTAQEGTQSGLVQYTSSLQQELTLGAGTYRVRLRVAQRACCGSQDKTVQVMVNNVVLGTVTPPSTFTTYTSRPFTVPLQVHSTNPAANARAAGRNTTVGLTFTEPIDAATASTIRVFSAQYQGRRRTTASTSGNTVTLTPTAASGAADFKPGETVQVSVPASVRGTSRVAAVPYVYQFTTAVGGTGTGNFTAPATNPNPAVGFGPNSVVVGDIDGDGDLDLLTANYSSNTVSVRLNDGTGNFTPPATNAEPAVGNGPCSATVGDVDGDGDLDLLTANQNSNTVSVRLNDGTGNFAPPAANPDPTVGTYPRGVAVGDVDGDGDLDLLTANYSSNTVSVRLNDGTGDFTSPATNAEPAVGTGTISVEVGDVDGDGDLDLLTANHSSNTVSVRLNDGTGNFAPPTNNPDPAVDNEPRSLALGDVDGDDDLDLLTTSYRRKTVSVRLNDGTGNFTAPATNPDPAVGTYPQCVVVGDVDGDGDLDLLTANLGSSSVSVRLNDGTGNFTAPATNPNPAIGNKPVSVVLGDVDGDGDLDLLTANSGTHSVNVRLNQPPAAVLSSLSASSAAPGGALTLSGTFLAGATSASFTNPATGVVTTVVEAAFTSTDYAATPSTIGLLVPAGLPAGSYTVSVTTPGGTSNALPLAVCVLTVAVQNVSVQLGPDGTVTVPASAFDNGSTSTCGPVTVTVQFQGERSGSVIEDNILTLTAPAGAVFASVLFASYGTPDVHTVGYALGSCHAAGSQAVVESYLLGRTGTVSIPATNAVFGDPCVNTAKFLAVRATYSYGPPSTQLRYDCADVGNQQVLVTLTDANGTSRQVTATVTVTRPPSTTTTWTGAANTTWPDCRNWSYGRLPSNTVSAVLPAGQPRYPILDGVTVGVQHLTIEQGASLTVNPGSTITVQGDWVNNGQADCAGTVALLGPAATQWLGGTSATAFSTLRVNKTIGTTVQLQRDVTVGSALNMTSGTLTTGSFRVLLGPAANISENTAAYITGTLACTRPVAAGVAELFGNLGLRLTPAAGSLAPGSTTVVRTTGTALTGAGSSQSIQRYFDIRPATNAGLDVTLDFTYFDHERNGIPAAGVALFKSTSPTGPWQPQNPITINGNVVRKTGITDFSLWTLGSAATPLPVELVSFTAEAQGPAALLRWTTASEKSNNRFEVEASADGTAFRRIGTVAGQGSSSTAHAYRFVDEQLAGYGSPQVYYRLRQVDQDGTFAYSPVRVVAVRVSSSASEGFRVYPTLLAMGESLRYALDGLLAQQAEGAELTVYTLTGQLLATQRLATEATGLVELPPLPPGMYLVRLRLPDGKPRAARFSVH